MEQRHRACQSTPLPPCLQHAERTSELPGFSCSFDPEQSRSARERRCCPALKLPDPICS